MDIEQLRQNAMEQGKTDVTKFLGYVLISLMLGTIVSMFGIKPLYTFTNIQAMFLYTFTGSMLLTIAHRSLAKLRREQVEREFAWTQMTDTEKAEALIAIYVTYLARSNSNTNLDDFSRRVKLGLQQAVLTSHGKYD